MKEKNKANITRGSVEWMKMSLDQKISHVNSIKSNQARKKEISKLIQEEKNSVILHYDREVGGILQYIDKEFSFLPQI